MIVWAMAFVSAFPTPKLSTTLNGHTDRVTAVAVSADENTIFSASADQSVRIWNAAGQSKEVKLGGPLNALLLRDGSRALAAGGKWAKGGPYDIFSLAADGSFTKFGEHDSAVLAESLSQDGKLLATATKDGVVSVWTVEDGKRLYTHAFDSAVAAITFTKDNMLIIAPSDRSLRVWEYTKEWKEQQRISVDKNVLTLATTSVRETFVAGCADGMIRVFAPPPAGGFDVPSDGSGPLVAVTFSRDAQTIFAANKAGDVRQISVADRTSGPFLSGVKARSLAATGNGLLVGTSDGRLLVYQHQRERPAIALDPQGHTAAVMDIAFTPDGSTLVSVSKDKTIRVWDVATGDNIRTIRGFVGQGDDGQLYRLAISPDGKEVAVGGFLGPNRGDTVGNVRVFSLSTGKLRTVISRAKNTVTALAWLPNRFMIGSSDKGVRLWNQEAMAKELAGGRANLNRYDLGGPVLMAAVSPNGNFVISNFFGNNEPWLLNMTTVSPQGKPQADKVLEKTHQGEVVAAAFTPDSSTLITADQYKAFVWSVDGTLKGEFPAKIHLAADSRIAFSADGSLVNFGAQVFEFPSGRQVSSFESNMTIRSAAFAGNDLLAIAGPRSGSGAEGMNDIVLLNPRTGKEVRRLGARARQFKGVAFLDSALGIALTDQVGTNQAVYQPGQIRFAFDFSHLRATQAKAPLGNGLVAEANGISLRRSGPDSSGNEDLAKLKLGEVTISAPNPVWAYTLLPGGEALLSAGGDMFTYDATGKETRKFEGHASSISGLALSADKRLLASVGDDSTVKIWRLDDRGETIGTHNVVRPLMSFFVASDNEWIAWSEDSTYASSRSGGRYLGFTKNQGRDKEGRFYPFEQFDLRYNRPDLVLERLGVGEPSLRRALTQAWKKRVKRMGFSEELVEQDITLPDVVLRTPSQVTRAGALDLDFTATSEKLGLDRLQIYVNDVPILGLAGQPLGGSRSVDKRVPLQLSVGRNKIQVSVLDSAGTESTRETIVVRYDAPEEKPTLFLVAIGVSSYTDTNYNLTYAAKDAADLVALLDPPKAVDDKSHLAKPKKAALVKKPAKKGKKGAPVAVEEAPPPPVAASAGPYKEVKVLLLADGKATRENVLKAREFLAQSKVDDEALIFFAGHGLLDQQLDYYLAMTDVDFAAPAARGLSYQELEGLFDGIPARKRLMLMDACNSGEVDKDGSALVAMNGAPPATAAGVKSRGFKKVVQSQVSLQGSFELVQELFADLRRTSGAAVISSASGREFAFESEQWKNGVFTFALLDGLKTRSADANKDGVVRVSELRDFVIDSVQKLTGGQQTPTSRRENLALDFAVF